MFKLLINAIVLAGAFAVKLNADTESSSSSLDAVSDFKREYANAMRRRKLAQTEVHAVSMEEEQLSPEDQKAILDQLCQEMPDADDSPAC